MTKSKTIHTPEGTFIVDADMDMEEFDPRSMVEAANPKDVEDVSEDSVTINGESFRGRLKTYTVTKNGVTGKTMVKVILVA